MSHLAEITQELFYSIISTDTVIHEVDSKETYTDIIYIVGDTKLFKRSQNNYANYYVVDINS